MALLKEHIVTLTGQFICRDCMEGRGIWSRMCETYWLVVRTKPENKYYEDQNVSKLGVCWVQTASGVVFILWLWWERKFSVMSQNGSVLEATGPAVPESTSPIACGNWHYAGQSFRLHRSGPLDAILEMADHLWLTRFVFLSDWFKISAQSPLELNL